MKFDLTVVSTCTVKNDKADSDQKKYDYKQRVIHPMPLVFF